MTTTEGPPPSEVVEEPMEELTPEEIDDAIKHNEEMPDEVRRTMGTPQVESKVSSKFLPLKRDLIDDILKINKKYSRRALGRMRKEELKTLLGSSFEEKCEEVLDDLPTHEKPEVMIQAMYNCCLGLCQLLETGTKRFHTYMPGHVVLHNFPENIDKPRNKEVILDCLETIYAKNAQLIKAYMTVETRLLFVFSVGAFASLKKYETINEARIQTMSHHKPHGRGQDHPNDIPDKGKKFTFGHVPPINRVFKPRRELGVPVPIRRFHEEKKPGLRSPRLSVHRQDNGQKPKIIPIPEAPDQNSFHFRRQSIEKRQKLPHD